MARIDVDPGRGLFLLSTMRTSHVVRVTSTPEAEDALVGTYTGPLVDLDAAADIAALDVPDWRGFESTLDGREEYPVAGGVRFGQPALAVRHPDGVRSVEWRFAGHRVTDEAGGHTLELDFADAAYPLRVTVAYRVHDGGDVVERWANVTNDGDGAAIELHRFDSGALPLPRRDAYRLSHLFGRWGAETQLQRLPDVAVGETVLTSRRGTTSHQANPWFAIDDGTATETRGEVVSGALAWSGSWRIVVRRTENGRAQVLAGFGHEAFGPYRLAPGETLTTPVFAHLWTDGGFGGASREWHAYARSHVLPRADEVRPVLYNSWEATGFDLDQPSQERLAERAADLGAELFVVDDGWFGSRTSDHAGLGDWHVNRERFPDGLGPLIERVHELGMAFGIWVEPEMVNPDSELYRAHPDWVYHFQNRTRHEMRNQLVLNLARRDVADWIYEQLHRLLAENDIAFVKWDMNRPFTEAGWPGDADNPDRLWLDHVHNLYRVWDRLRTAHPDVAIESCSGGGARIDFGILARADQVWTSDNTDASDRLVIQHGFSQLYPARAMTCWVTDVPNFLTTRDVSLRYRFHAAMTGVLGIGGDLSQWAPTDLAQARELVAEYKRIRTVVQLGTQYRLSAPGTGLTAVQYTSADGAHTVLFAFLEGGRFGERPAPVRLAALDAAARYRVSGDGVEERELSGAALFGHGLPLDLRGDHASVLVHVERV
ncbi:MAG: alpha-galactosidase [Streptosporangiales bacterium]|nr:alpha-galactosidase [Streptosporangiales bacterium]MBO0890468.1 alpha-galactosidase [Acidothermales bacterium]